MKTLNDFNKELKQLLRQCKNNAERLAVLNDLRQQLIEEEAQLRGFDLETTKGQTAAFAFAYRKNPELFSNSLMDRY